MLLRDTHLVKLAGRPARIGFLCDPGHRLIIHVFDGFGPPPHLCIIRIFVFEFVDIA
jgi:hypothetical protein